LLGELHELDLGSLQTECTDSKSEEEVLPCRLSRLEKDPFVQCLQGEMRSLVANALEDLDKKNSKC
jgi:hypothetical protein